MDGEWHRWALPRGLFLLLALVNTVGAERGGYGPLDAVKNVTPTCDKWESKADEGELERGSTSTVRLLNAALYCDIIMNVLHQRSNPNPDPNPNPHLHPHLHPNTNPNPNPKPSPSHLNPHPNPKPSP